MWAASCRGQHFSFSTEFLCWKKRVVLPPLVATVFKEISDSLCLHTWKLNQFQRTEEALLIPIWMSAEKPAGWLCSKQHKLKRAGCSQKFKLINRVDISPRPCVCSCVSECPVCFVCTWWFFLSDPCRSAVLSVRRWQSSVPASRRTLWWRGGRAVPAARWGAAGEVDAGGEGESVLLLPWQPSTPYVALICSSTPQPWAERGSKVKVQQQDFGLLWLPDVLWRFLHEDINLQVITGDPGWLIRSWLNDLWQ